MRKSEQLSSATNTQPFLKGKINSEMVNRIDSEMADKLQCLVRCKPKCLKCLMRKHCTNPFFTSFILKIYTQLNITIRWAEHLLIPETNIRTHTPLLSYECKHTPQSLYVSDTISYVMIEFECSYCGKTFKKQIRSKRMFCLECNEIIGVYIKSLHGSKCERCGYDKVNILEFHHIDGKNKEFALGQHYKSGKTIPELVAEANKCILVCKNCHAEIHFGNV
jgi:protein-arginine kinase activator protein McsA